MLSNNKTSPELDQRLLAFAVQLQVLPPDGKMDSPGDVKDRNDHQEAVVHWIEHYQKDPPIQRTQGKIVYDEEAMASVGIEGDEAKAEEMMKRFCKELRSGRETESNETLSVAGRLNRLAFLSAMTGKGSFGVTLDYSKTVYPLLYELAKLAQLGSPEQEKAKRFLQLLDHLSQEGSIQEKVTRLKEVIECINQQKISNNGEEFFDACFKRIDIQLSNSYKTHIKTLESELVVYKKYLKSFEQSQQDKDVRKEVCQRIDQCNELITKCKETGPIEHRLKSIASGIEKLEKPFADASKVSGRFEKPSEYGGLHSTWNALLDLVGKYFPSVLSYKSRGFSSTKTKSFDTEEVNKGIKNVFKRK